MKTKLTLLLVGGIFGRMLAQSLPLCPNGTGPSDNCSQACVACNFQNGFSINSINFTPDIPPTDCLVMHDNMWFAFYISEPNVTFTAIPSNCTVGNGIQMALYESCQSACVDFDYGCLGCGNNPVSIAATGLSVGAVYYLVIDGFYIDTCDIQIFVDPISAIQAPPVGNSGPIQGPSNACPNGTFTFCVDEAAGASNYVWTVPPGGSVNGIAGPAPVALRGPEGRCANITFGPGTGPKQICVRPVNACKQGPQQCKTVNVQKIPDTNLPPAIVCQKDADNYQLPWGEAISPVAGTQTYQTTVGSDAGCDSILKMAVTVLAPVNVTLPIQVICPGECLTIGNETFCTAGSHTTTMSSSLGCDSVIHFNLIVLDIAAKITNSGTLTCNTAAVTLHSAPQAGSTKIWKNAQGQSLGTADSLVATQAGKYFLFVNLQQNNLSCTRVDSIVVSEDRIAPSDTATAVGYIGCSTTAVQLQALSNGLNPVFAWSGPNSFTANIANPLANAVGTYQVTVTAANGCSATASVSVSTDTTAPVVMASAGMITCTATTTTIHASASAAQASFAWSGPNNFNAGVPDTVVSAAGDYHVTVTDPANGCTATAVASVEINFIPPDLTVSSSGVLACNTPQISLLAQAPSGALFSWSGPNGFSSVLQQPQVQTAGTYTVTISDAGGCTNSATVEVSADTTLPAVAATGGILNCATPTVTLNAGGNTAGATYAWTGPGNFTAAVSDPIIALAGDYFLTVTGSNGCTAVDTAAVGLDLAIPDVAATGGVLSCSETSVLLSGASQTPGVQFAWNGPGNFSSDQPAVAVSQTGEYLLRVTAPNGCFATATATVTPDANLPNIVANGGILTCTTSTVLLDGGSTTAGATFAWSGPGNFTATVEDVYIGTPGQYVLTVTDPANGCTTSASLTIPEDKTLPSATVTGGTITCTTPGIVLQGQSTTANTTWLWTGPGNFTSADPMPMANQAGDYTLVVTDPANGCSASATVQILADQTLPQASASAAGILTCAQTALTLHGSSNAPGTLSWAGPGGFSSDLPHPQVQEPGAYLLTVTGQNGCTDTAAVWVERDVAVPGVSAQGDTLDCFAGTATLWGTSPTPGVTWSWSGPANFSSSQQNPDATTPGIYTLTITASNGCTATATAGVSQNADAPPLSIVAADTVLTCATTAIVLTAHTSPGATGQWSTGATTSSLTVKTAGVFTFTAQGANGCQATQSIQVVQQSDPPQQVTASGGQTNCAATVLTLQGNAGTPGVTWNWSGPANFSSTLQNPGNVGTPGTYTLVVTNPANGCTASATATVTQDLAAPTVSATADSLTCSIQSVTLQVNSSPANLGFHWEGPGNFSSSQTSPQVSLAGTYRVTVTAGNGCTATYSLVVQQNILPPGASAQGDTLRCNKLTGTLSGMSPAAGAAYAWSGPVNFNSSQQNPVVNTAGIYQLTVTGANGCTSTAQATVAPDLNPPAVSATGGTITCLLSGIALSALSGPGTSWQWAGPGNFNSTLSDPVVSEAGTYTLTGTGPNGCTATATALVLTDTSAPFFSLTLPADLNCNTIQVAIGATVQSPANFSAQWSTLNGHILDGANTATATVDQAGAYTLTLRNLQNGCTSVQTAVVSANASIPTAMTLKTRDISCFGYHDGVIAVDAVAGGTPPLLFSLDGQAFTSALKYEQLPPGQHSIRLLDASGCELETSAFLQEPAPLLVSLGPDTLLHLGNPIELPVLGAVSDPQRITQVITQPLPISADTVVFPLKPFLYSLWVSDSNHCTASGKRYIQVDKHRQVYVPNAFHPQGNTNDIFTVFGGPDVRIVRTFRVYDRWGSVVHEAYGFLPNDYSAGWDGRVRGQAVAPAVFTYFVEIEFIDNQVEVFSGDVTVLE